MLSVVIAKNTLYQIVAKLTTSGVGFLTTILIARYIGAAGYGDFTKITSFVALFYLLTDFGLNAIFIQKDEKQTHFRDLFYTRLLLSIVLLLLGNIAAWTLSFFSGSDVGYPHAVLAGIAIFSLTIITQAIITTASSVFQRKLWYSRLMQASFVGGATTFFLVFMVTLFTLPLWCILASFVIGGFLTSKLVIAWTQEPIFPIIIDKQFIKGLFKESWPLGLMIIFNLVYVRADIILLSFLKPASDVGIYGLAYKFFDFLIALPLFLSNSLYVKLLDEQNFGNFFSRAIKYVLLFAGTSLIIVVPFWLFSPFISLIREDFSPAILPFKILLLSLPIFFVTNILQWLLISKKQQKFLLFTYGIVTAANIILNIIFIPRYSYMASAIITGVLEGVVLLLLLGKFFWLKTTAQKLLQNTNQSEGW